MVCGVWLLLIVQSHATLLSLHYDNITSESENIVQMFRDVDIV